MADFFIDNHIKNAINHLILHKSEIKDDTEIWKSLTRMMFINYPAMEVLRWVEIALEEASDEQWFENKYPKEIFEEKIKPVYYKDNSIRTINANLKISEVAGRYGINVKKMKALCPFHSDSQPSLSFNDEKNIFHCFGCNKSGDIITFIGLMEDLKNG